MADVKETEHKESLADYFKNVFRHRFLIITLVKRDLKVKYAQTFLGFFWVLLQPLTGVVVFSIFFNKILNINDWGISMPYYLYAFSGMISWIFFTSVLQSAGTSLISEEALIKKIYFPRLMLPIVRTISSMLDFGISCLVLIVIALLSGLHIPINILAVPAILLVNSIVALSIAIWLSALTIRYRDFHHIIPYIINFGIWLTPVFYPASLIPENYQWLIYINPMAGVLDLFRWAFFGTSLPSVYFVFTFIITSLLFFSGLLYFRKVEKLIADYL